MKIDRSATDMGGGSGHTHFESDAFRVVHWSLSRGKQTMIENKYMEWTGDEVRFDGYHNFNSDSDCLEQLTSEEIFETIKYQKEKSFQAGRDSMTKDIRGLLFGK